MQTLQHCQHLGTEHWQGSGDGNRMGEAEPMLGVLLPADIVACGGDANPHDVVRCAA